LCVIQSVLGSALGLTLVASSLCPPLEVRKERRNLAEKSALFAVGELRGAVFVEDLRDGWDARDLRHGAAPELAQHDLK
jgi:hypothetical protein